MIVTAPDDNLKAALHGLVFGEHELPAKQYRVFLDAYYKALANGIGGAEMDIIMKTDGLAAKVKKLVDDPKLGDVQLGEAVKKAYMGDKRIGFSRALELKNPY